MSHTHISLHESGHAMIHRSTDSTDGAPTATHEKNQIDAFSAKQLQVHASP